jgi:hypothetical protein
MGEIKMDGLKSKGTYISKRERGRESYILPLSKEFLRGCEGN